MPSKYILKDIDIEELIADSHLLNCLLDNAVVDWEGYDDAWQQFNDSYHSTYNDVLTEYPEFVEGDLR